MMTNAGRGNTRGWGMGALRDAINAKATPHQRAAMVAADWCKASGWTRICDIPSGAYEDVVTYTWETLPDAERSLWIGNYQQDARDVWARFGRGGAYKVPVGYIMDDGEFVEHRQFHRMDLAGRGFMMVFDLRSKGE